MSINGRPSYGAPTYGTVGGPIANLYIVNGVVQNAVCGGSPYTQQMPYQVNPAYGY